MNKEQKRIEREERAARLVEARKNAGFKGPTPVAEKLDISINNYKAHEQGRNGFEVVDARRYAKLFGVSLKWLMLGEGDPLDFSEETPDVQDIPFVSWVSAGEMTEQEGVVDTSQFPTVPAVNLPDGDWIALRVDGPSMNKISPPDSIIFVNMKDKRLVSNGCYVISDETGKATYKRYRPNEEPQFQPASYEKIEPPLLEGVITVIGRVKRSVIDM